MTLPEAHLAPPPGAPTSGAAKRTAAGHWPLFWMNSTVAGTTGAGELAAIAGPPHHSSPIINSVAVLSIAEE